MEIRNNIYLKNPFKMKNNRREFLKRTGLAWTSLVGTGIMSAYSLDQKGEGKSNLDPTQENQRTQKFNMSGYSAPKLDTNGINV